jgi:hypothetical protein
MKTIWMEYPENQPPVDDDGESTYLLVLCDKAVAPLSAYFSGGVFFQLGCPGGVLHNVRAWAPMVKVPARFFKPHTLRYAAEIIETEGEANG